LPSWQRYDRRTVTTSHARAWTAVALAVALTLACAAAGPQARAAAPATRDVLVVGNNWDGTADIVDPHALKVLTRLNVVPDLAQRMAEIAADPVALGFFDANRLLIGEGHDQYVDDAFTSPDGRLLYVGRPSLADVVAIDLGTRAIVWRVKVEGYRSDHMAISPDGTRLLVSASTAKKVQVIDTRRGAIVGEFASGDQPHESNFSADGTRIFHASIGSVYTPLDDPALDATKGERVFEIVDAHSYAILARVDVGKALADNGFPGYSSAVRPMALSPDERFAYLQLSFLHGFVEFDLRTLKPTRIAKLPLSAAAKGLPRESYLLDSAHHGIAMSHDGRKLCVAGTMSDYAAIVARDDFSYKLLDSGRRPYWATNSADGRYCFVSASGDDKVTVISYADERVVQTIAVGDHPQRMRAGVMRAEYLPPPDDTAAPRLRRVRVLRTAAGRALALALNEDARLRIAVQRARRGRWANVRVVTRDVRAGTVRVGLGRLRARGRHRLVVTATDAAGNSSARRLVRFRVRG
jgi:DNA-binding beta-propeller fold protein YncE